jgi:predicted RNase H-like HicB family nuclease
MSHHKATLNTMKDTPHADAYVIAIAKGKDGYSALSPDIPGCYTVGDTLEETLKHMREALAFHLEDEESVPAPKGIEYHLRNDTELRDARFIFAHIPVEEVTPLAFA